jgi:hypothetical protein
MDDHDIVRPEHLHEGRGVGGAPALVGVALGLNVAAGDRAVKRRQPIRCQYLGEALGAIP